MYIDLKFNLFKWVFKFGGMEILKFFKKMMWGYNVKSYSFLNIILKKWRFFD